MYYGISVYSLFESLIKNTIKKLKLCKSKFSVNFLKFSMFILLSILMLYQISKLIDKFENSNNKFIITFERKIFFPSITFQLRQIINTNDHDLQFDHNGVELYFNLLSNLTFTLDLFKPRKNFLTTIISSNEKVLNLTENNLYLHSHKVFIYLIFYVDTDKLNSMKLKNIDKLELIIKNRQYQFVNIKLMDYAHKKVLYYLPINSYSKYILKLDPIFNYVDGENFGDSDGIFHSTRREKCLIKCVNDKHIKNFDCIPFYDSSHQIMILKFDEINQTR